MSQGSLYPKIRFLAQKLWSVARVQRNRQTHTQTDRQTRKGLQRAPFHGFRISSFNLSSRIGPIIIIIIFFKSEKPTEPVKHVANCRNCRHFNCWVQSIDGHFNRLAPSLVEIRIVYTCTAQSTFTSFFKEIDDRPKRPKFSLTRDTVIKMKISLISLTVICVLLCNVVEGKVSTEDFGLHI